MIKFIYITLMQLFLFSQVYPQSRDTTIYRSESSIIQFKLQNCDTANVTIYNMLGKYVTEKSFYKPGLYRIRLKSFHIPVGMYFIRIKISHRSIVKKVIVTP